MIYQSIDRRPKANWSPEKFCLKNNEAKKSVGSLNLSSKKINQRRTSYSFEKGLTPATMIEDHEHTKDYSLPTSHLDELAQRVADHAYTRIQLFYGLLTLYYKAGCRVKTATTNLQHGISKCEHCSAAHSSLLPNVKDDFFPSLANSIIETGIDESNRKKLLDLGVLEDKIQKLSTENLGEYKANTILNRLGLGKQQKLLKSNSQFYHNLNSTIELPKINNLVDSILEKNLRGTAIGIVNNVSNGLNPYKGTVEMANHLSDFFNISINKTKEKIAVLKEISSTQEKVKNLENSIFRCSTITSKKDWLTSYITLNRNLKILSTELDKCSSHTVPIQYWSQIEENKALVEWIENHFRKEREHLNKTSSRKKLKNFLQTLVKGKNKKFVLEEFEKIALFENQKKYIEKILEGRESIEHLLSDDQRVKGIFNHAMGEIERGPKWDPKPIEESIELLESSMEIMQWQKNGSTPPPKEYLNTQEDKDDEENWFQQKREILNISIPN